VPLTINAGSSVIADDTFAIDAEFAHPIAASAPGNGVGKTRQRMVGDASAGCWSFAAGAKSLVTLRPISEQPRPKTRKCLPQTGQSGVAISSAKVPFPSSRRRSTT
jgi:hypothetical protein